MIELAKQIAIKAHAGQKRKFGNHEDYINHPMRLMERAKAEGWPEEIQQIAILHDVIEDSDATLLELGLNGFSTPVLLALAALTRLEGENYFDFIMRIKVNTMARVVKILDLEDNLNGLHEGSMKDKYRLALYILTRRIQ